MSHRRAESLSFLLRLWQVEDNGGLLWRASLEDALGNQWGFADLAVLSAFLRSQIASTPDGDTGEVAKVPPSDLSSPRDD